MDGVFCPGCIPAYKMEKWTQNIWLVLNCGIMSVSATVAVVNLSLHVWDSCPLTGWNTCLINNFVVMLGILTQLLKILWPNQKCNIPLQYILHSWISLLSTDPANPPAPTELRVANLNFGPGRVVSARLQWSMSPDLDVPIHHYKVSWSWSHAGQFAASSLNKRKKTVQQVILRILKHVHCL